MPSDSKALSYWGNDRVLKITFPFQGYYTL